MTTRLQRLASTAHEKVWGSPDTEPWYRNPERRNIGEIWFPASDSVPILVKLLFTSDNLSVQVHPQDDYARRHHDSRGKTEIWHILRAEPSARVAIGLREAVSPGRLRAAALSGEIMDMLNWLPARPGDTFFVPAGAVHAIGGGLALCEIQQHSDVTYRLYDYGRPRELHLDRALDVWIPEPIAARSSLPFQCPHFQAEKLTVTGSHTFLPPAQSTLCIAVEGGGSIAGEPFRAGEAWQISPGAAPFEIVSPHAVFLITSESR